MNLIVKRVVILLLALHTVFCGNAQDFCIIEDGYAYFHNHPKTNGIDFKVRIPKNWKIEEGNRPHIVAKITNDDLSTFLIISQIAVHSFHVIWQKRYTRRDVLNSGQLMNIAQEVLL